MSDLTCVEICAGAGGQALGLELAGFAHQAVVEIDHDACETLRLNRPEWDVEEVDVHHFDGAPHAGADLLAGGVPCPPFSVAGKQLGPDDERDLFPQALRLVGEMRPSAVMLENVRGLASPKFEAYRAGIIARLRALGYECDWQLVNASQFGVPQLRPRFILVALPAESMEHFRWPQTLSRPATVGETLLPLMRADGWRGAESWAAKAHGVAPTIVGGSRKHGGPDLGPTRARAQWLQLGVDGRGIADQVPGSTHPDDHLPKLTLPMVATLQGFPEAWEFSGRKTSAYRQIGNAFPPPVAQAVGQSIAVAIVAARTTWDAAAPGVARRRVS
jgi:DNA (cytosine-5)-methyltransferase 1